VACGGISKNAPNPVKRRVSVMCGSSCRVFAGHREFLQQEKAALCQGGIFPCSRFLSVNITSSNIIRRRASGGGIRGGHQRRVSEAGIRGRVSGSGIRFGHRSRTSEPLLIEHRFR